MKTSSLPLSSPRTRGYFQQGLRIHPIQPLFPAHAGVFPVLITGACGLMALPRARGGISMVKGIISGAMSSSPRTRGYFRQHFSGICPNPLFPAHAGVFPRSSRSPSLIVSLPRARGGISALDQYQRLNGSSSPRTRGYFLILFASLAMVLLFPAHAGVFPTAIQMCLSRFPLPRARGGISDT